MSCNDIQLAPGSHSSQIIVASREVELLAAYVNATRPRAVGWVGFYWAAGALRVAPAGAAVYNRWLKAWAAARPAA